MNLEVHILQNFAPSNLNRDESGSPKDCEFGGYRRARISSQCLKRAIRNSFRDEDLVPPEQRAVRTKWLIGEVADRLVQAGHDAALARLAVEVALGSIGLTTDGKDARKTQYLLFLGADEIERITRICAEHWDALATGTGDGRRDKKAAKGAMPKEVREALLRALDGGRAADLALFGRMLADLPERNIDAACQVAHAISTNRVTSEFDYFSAIDDLPSPDDEPGAGMLGLVGFNSSCYYRYANVNLKQLHANLGDDDELARETVRAFLQASVLAIPTGKQNSMAAQNLPSLVFVVLRERGLTSLANAFLKPVVADRVVRDDSKDLVAKSMLALDQHWGQLLTMYPHTGRLEVWLAHCTEAEPVNLAGAVQPNVSAVIDGVVAALPYAPLSA